MSTPALRMTEKIPPKPSSAAAPDASKKSDRFPPGIPYIVGNEGAERFSFYGMKAILKIYLIALFAHSMTQTDAIARSTAIVHLFVAGVYAFPLLGAVVADRWLGKYRVIMWVSSLYCVGHAILAVAGRLDVMGRKELAITSVTLGLAVIAVGSGGIKPCVSANVGDQFSKENGHLITKVFQTFYFMINFGSFFSTIATPWLYDKYGPEIAFGVPGVLMAVATLVFFLGRKRFVPVPPKPGGVLGFLDSIVVLLLLNPLLVLAFGGFLEATAASVFDGVAIQWGKYGLQAGVSAALFALGLVLFGLRQRRQPDNSFLPVFLYAVRNQHQRKSGQGYFDVARAKYGEEAGDGPPAVLRIMVVFSMVTVFWALFDQHASTWIDQAARMNLKMTVPATVAQWSKVAVGGLSLFALYWIMSWVSNRAVPKALTVGVLALAGISGAAAALNDAVGVPLGDVVEGVKTSFVSFDLNPAQLSALNPLLVMIIIPLLNVAVYAPLRKRGIEVKPLQRMTIGMFLAAISFVAAAVLQKAIEVRGDGQVHALWQAVPYTIITAGEVLVSITGLEFAYTQAPRAMKSTIMSFWLLCVTFGNLLVAFLAPLQKTFELSAFFWIFAALMATASVLFAVLAYFYRGKTYLQAESAH